MQNQRQRVLHRYHELDWLGQGRARTGPVNCPGRPGGCPHGRM